MVLYPLPHFNYTTVFSRHTNALTEQNQTSRVQPTKACLIQANRWTPAKWSIAHLGLGAWPALHWASPGTLQAVSSSVPCSACSPSGIWSWLHALNKQTERRLWMTSKWLSWLAQDHPTGKCKRGGVLDSSESQQPSAYSALGLGSGITD